MARIWKRRDRDTWTVDFRDAGGIRRRLTVDSRAQAEALLADKVKESKEGPQLVVGEDLMLVDYAGRWLAMAATRLKARTVTSYRQLLDLHIVPTLGHLRMREVHRVHVKQLLANKHESGLSRNTVRLVRAALSAMFAEAVDDGMVKANPAALASRRRGATAADGISQTERHKAIRPMSDADLRAFLDAAQEDAEYGTFFLLLARTGARPGEALALKWEDLNLSAREILIERAMSAGELSTTKTGHARNVDMSLELAQALTKLYRERERQALERGWGEVPEWIFCNRLGGPLEESRTRKRFTRAMRRAGLSGHRMYDLRHGFATTLLARGVPITYVAGQLGHAKPTTTLTWYAHWLPRNDKSFVDSLDRSAEFLAPTVGTKVDPDRNESEKTLDFIGATRRIRTDDLLITNLAVRATTIPA
jgi:integrase